MQPVNRIKAAEFERNIHAARVDVNTSPIDVQKPEFWAHVAKGLRPGDRIEVEPEDRSWFLELYVVSSSNLWAKTRVMRLVDLTKGEGAETPVDLPPEAVKDADGGATAENTTPAEGSEPEYSVSWGNKTTKFRVIRKSDNEVLESGIATKEEADAWLVEFLASLEE